MDILTSLDFLQVGQEFPPPSQLKRLNKYRHNKQLYNKTRVIDRKSYNHIVQVMQDSWRVVPYSLMINFYRKISYKTADMLFIEPPVFGAGEDDAKKETVNQVVLNSTLLDIGRQSAIDTSRYGEGVLVITERDGQGVITITQPRYWFPVADPEDLRSIKYHVLAWIGDERNTKDGREFTLTVHIHEKGSVTKYEAKLKGNLIESVKEIEAINTGLDDFAVLPVQPNLTSDSAFSDDDYTDIEDIVTEIQTRIQQIAKVLDKHAEPLLSGPASALTLDPDTGERVMVAGGNFLMRETNDDPIVEYITWDAQMDASFKEIELMMNLLAIISEMGPAIFYDEVLKLGSISGRALRMLYINALNKVARTRNAFDSVLKRGIYLASQIGYSVTLERDDVGIKWNDGLPDDPMEKAEIGKIRLDNAPSDSVISQIMQQDGLSEEQAQEKYDQMQTENAQNVPPLNLGGFGENIGENNETE